MKASLKFITNGKVVSISVNFLYILAMVILITRGINYVKTGSFTVFGYKVLRIASESMEPTLMTGDFVMAKQVKADEEIEVGGIYTYVAENGFYTVTHRIVAEEDKNGDKYYIFKGDNNDEQDPKPIHRKRVKFKIKVK